MKRTTLALDERVIEQVRNKARREGSTFQECANKLLRIGLEASASVRKKTKPLPNYSLGKASVDVADRDALYDLMERE